MHQFPRIIDSQLFSSCNLPDIERKDNQLQIMEKPTDTILDDIRIR